MYYYIVKANGEVSEKKTEKQMELDDFYKVTGGYIETTVVRNTNYLLIMDEERKLKEKPVNRVATILYGNPYDVIVGDIIIATMRKDENGEMDIFGFEEPVPKLRALVNSKEKER